MRYLGNIIRDDLCDDLLFRSEERAIFEGVFIAKDEDVTKFVDYIHNTTKHVRLQTIFSYIYTVYIYMYIYIYIQYICVCVCVCVLDHNNSSEEFVKLNLCPICINHFP